MSKIKHWLFVINCLFSDVKNNKVCIFFKKDKYLHGLNISLFSGKSEIAHGSNIASTNAGCKKRQ